MLINTHFSNVATAKVRCSRDELDRHVIPKIAHKWFQLGQYFRLDLKFLHDTETYMKDNTTASCKVMFTEWLMRPELQPSWEKLIEALKSDVVSATELAAELSDKYLQ